MVVAVIFQNVSSGFRISANFKNNPLFFIHRFTSPTSPSKRTLPSTAAVVANNAAAALVAAAQNNQQKLPLPDSRSMDWSSLVNTATKAIKTDDETTIVDLEANNEATMASKSRKLPEKRYILSLFANFHLKKEL